jgi:hypothetical protein
MILLAPTLTMIFTNAEFYHDENHGNHIKGVKHFVIPFKRGMKVGFPGENLRFG